MATPSAHALLSPSSASRWLVCTPSARLEGKYPDSESEAAREGTLAHSLGELIIKLKLNQITTQKYNVELRAIKKNKLYSPSMLGYCTDYAAYVLEQFYAMVELDPKAKIFIEEKLDLTAYVPEGFGTSDITLLGAGRLHTIDLKYGKGVLVEAEGNKQLPIYALGALEKFAKTFKHKTYAVKDVYMTIYQPRLDNVVTATSTVKDLLDWAEEVLQPKAQAAFEGKGEFVTGAHCRFCRVRDCRARADKNMELAKFDFAVPATLSVDEVAEILENIDEFVNWGKALSDYALATAVDGTKVYPGFKVVHGRSNRVVSNESKLAAGLKEMGFKDDEIYSRSLVNLTALEGLAGKELLAKKFGDCIIKPYGKPTLVPLTDKRPGFGIASAIAAFGPLNAETEWENLLK